MVDPLLNEEQTKRVIDISRRAIDTFGISAQLSKLGEECNELSRAIHRLDDPMNFFEELVDVWFMVCQIAPNVMNGSTFSEILTLKLNRLEQLIKEHKEKPSDAQSNT